MGKILLYGCTGYTGKLIAIEAARRKMDVVLCGRNKEKVEEISKLTGLPFVVASLEDPASLDNAMKGISVVLHCAGPFIDTAPAMIAACFKNKVHYLDITGEIDVFESCAALTVEAEMSSVMLMPGVGFDVVPTDCLAARLKAALPDAQSLELVIKNNGGGISHGTASTMIKNLGTGSFVRRNGKITQVPMASPTISVDFGKGPILAAGMPWGDVSTAYYTTGIPNIVVAFALPPKTLKNLKRSRYINFLLRLNWVKKLIQRKIDQAPAGPSDASRAKSNSQIWGRVVNAKGQEKTMQIETPNGYTLTVLTGLLIAEKVQKGIAKAGFQTPAGLFGPNILDEAINVINV